MKKLNGSEKQIAWAEQIREKAIAKIQEEKDSLIAQAKAMIEADSSKQAQYDEFMKMVETGEELALNELDVETASKLIDMKDYTPSIVVSYQKSVGLA